ERSPRCSPSDAITRVSRSRRRWSARTPPRWIRFFRRLLRQPLDPVDDGREGSVDVVVPEAREQRVVKAMASFAERTQAGQRQVHGNAPVVVAEDPEAGDGEVTQARHG